MVNLNVLKYIMNLAVSDNAYFQVNAITNQTLNKIAALIDEDVYSNHYKTLIGRFKKNPNEFKLNFSPKIPDGSPIGSDMCNYNPNY